MWGATPGARDISCRRFCSLPLFRPPILGYRGLGAPMSGVNHPPCTHLDPVSTSFISRSCTIGARPRAHGTYRVGSLPLSRPPILGYIRWGAPKSGVNHPPCTHFDLGSTSSIPRSCTVGARPRAHRTYRVVDSVHSPFFDPQSWDISGGGH